MEFKIEDYVKSEPSLSFGDGEPFYMDNHTFQFNPKYLYMGLISSGNSYQLKTLGGNDVKLWQKCNLIPFVNIQGVFAFIGYRYRFDDTTNRDFSIMPPIDFGEFNNDFGMDFNI